MLIHIILGILKIIGILLLVILCLLLLLALAILFVPVRYEGTAYKKDGDYCVKARVSWLFRLFYVACAYGKQTEGAKIQVRILGISLEWLTARIEKVREWKDKRNARKISKKKADSRKKKEKPEHELTALETRGETEVSQLKTEKIIESSPDDNLKEQDVEQSLGPEEELQGRSPKEALGIPKAHAGKKENKFLSFIKMLLRLPGKIYQALKNFKLTIDGICDKIKQVILFWKSDDFQGAKTAALRELKRVMKHILPKKLEGEIFFGFDDPYLTGNILAAAGMFYPLYGNHVSLYPYFDKNILEGRLALKGRVYGFMLLYLAWNLYSDEHIKELIKMRRH